MPAKSVSGQARKHAPQSVAAAPPNAKHRPDTSNNPRCQRASAGAQKKPWRFLNQPELSSLIRKVRFASLPDPLFRKGLPHEILATIARPFHMPATRPQSLPACRRTASHRHGLRGRGNLALCSFQFHRAAQYIPITRFVKRHGCNLRLAVGLHCSPMADAFFDRVRPTR